jgi:hypothetical protein
MTAFGLFGERHGLGVPVTLRAIARWALASLLLLASAAITAGAALLALARYTVGPMMGVGPSVSEVMSGLLVTLAGATICAVLSLGGLTAFWRARRSSHIPHGSRMRNLLLGVPLLILFLPVLLAISSYLATYRDRWVPTYCQSALTAPRVPAPFRCL